MNPGLLAVLQPRMVCFWCCVADSGICVDDVLQMLFVVSPLGKHLLSSVRWHDTNVASSSLFIDFSSAWTAVQRAPRPPPISSSPRWSSSTSRTPTPQLPPSPAATTSPLHSSPATKTGWGSSRWGNKFFVLSVGLICAERSNHLPLQVGWSKTRDYHTFVWVDSSQDGTGHQSEIRQAVFNGNKSHFSCRVGVCTIRHSEHSVRLMLTLWQALVFNILAWTRQNRCLKTSD